MTTNSLNEGRITKSLLGWGIIAGPTYVIVGALEMALRPGFNPTRHALSLMSNGDLGWIHILMMFATGVFTILGAIGLKRAKDTSLAKSWAPYLLGVFGLGFIGASFFTADPALGFPLGTPADATQVSWHGMMHFVCGGVGFLGFIGACFSAARSYARDGEKVRSIYAVITGVAFFTAFVGIASGSGNSVTILTFTAAIVLAWAWFTALSINVYQAQGDTCAPVSALTA
jgi:hypothetical protein